MKYSWHGQILTAVLTHIELAFIFFIVWTVSITVTGTKIGGLIYSIISAVFYSVMMYYVGYSSAKNDKKSYSKLKPFAPKGAVIALGVLFLNILTAVLYKTAWAIGSDGESFNKIWAFSANLFSLFWFSPYINLLGMDKGNIAYYGYAVIVFLNTTACFFGYLAGYKDFDISKKLGFLIYEKKK